MGRIKGTSIQTISVNGDSYSIRITEHAFKQAYTRKVSADVIARTISALGTQRLTISQKIGSDAAVVNEEEGVAVVFSWDGNKIMVITVLDSNEVDNFFVKRGTILQFV